MNPVATSRLISARLEHLARTIWRGLREWSGDAAYDRYLSSRARRTDHRRPLAAGEFYIEQLNRRYSRPNRCC